MKDFLKDFFEVYFQKLQENNFEDLFSLYDEKALIVSPVLGDQNPLAMKNILQKNIKNLKIIYKNPIFIGENCMEVSGILQYLYLPTNTMIYQPIFAVFVLENGKIIRHKNEFDSLGFYKQAYFRFVLDKIKNFFKKK